MSTAVSSQTAGTATVRRRPGGRARGVPTRLFWGGRGRGRAGVGGWGRGRRQGRPCSHRAPASAPLSDLFGDRARGHDGRPPQDAGARVVDEPRAGGRPRGHGTRLAAGPRHPRARHGRDRGGDAAAGRHGGRRVEPGVDAACDRGPPPLAARLQHPRAGCRRGPQCVGRGRARGRAGGRESEPGRGVAAGCERQRAQLGAVGAGWQGGRRRTGLAPRARDKGRHLKGDRGKGGGRRVARRRAAAPAAATTSHHLP